VPACGAFHCGMTWVVLKQAMGACEGDWAGLQCWELASRGWRGRNQCDRQKGGDIKGAAGGGLVWLQSPG